MKSHTPYMAFSLRCWFKAQPPKNHPAHWHLILQEVGGQRVHQEFESPKALLRFLEDQLQEMARRPSNL